MKLNVETYDVTQPIIAFEGYFLRKIMQTIGGRPLVFGRILNTFPGTGAAYFYLKSKLGKSFGESIWKDGGSEGTCIALRIYKEDADPAIANWEIKVTEPPLEADLEIVLDLDAEVESPN